MRTDHVNYDLADREKALTFTGYKVQFELTVSSKQDRCKLEIMKFPSSLHSQRGREGSVGKLLSLACVLPVCQKQLSITRT